MKNIVIGIGGLLFGFGLGVSTMHKQEVVISFLELTDLGLLLVMVCAIFFGFLAFHLIPKFRTKSLLGGDFLFKEKPIGKNVIVGAILFGIGWGISGICPGSAIASLGTGNFPILLGIGGMAIGAFITDKFLAKRFT